MQTYRLIYFIMSLLVLSPSLSAFAQAPSDLAKYRAVKTQFLEVLNQAKDQILQNQNQPDLQAKFLFKLKQQLSQFEAQAINTNDYETYMKAELASNYDEALDPIFEVYESKIKSHSVRCRTMKEKFDFQNANAGQNETIIIRPEVQFAENLFKSLCP